MPCDKQRAAALICVLFSVACFAQSPNASAGPAPLLVHKKKYVMGTVFEIVVYDTSAEHASAAIDKAFREIARIDELMSEYKSDSALSRLNRSAHFHAQAVPLDLYRVIEEAARFSALSNGKFDISIAPLVNLWKGAIRGDAAPSLEQEQRLRACVGYDKIELTPPDRITFHSSCLTLDLGSIGKGYAVDRAVEVLRSSGVSSALINAGGSTLFAIGSPPRQSAWLVHLRDPSGKIDPQVMLKDESVSTSEQTHSSLLGTNAAGHIIDPDTGSPLTTQFAVSTIAPTATVSDALSTTLLLLGPAGGKALLNRMPDVSAVWISPEARVETVTGRTQILRERGL